MRLAKVVGVVVVLGGLAVAAAVAQDRRDEPPRRRAVEMNILGGPQLGVSARDLGQAEADRQKSTGGAVVEKVEAFTARMPELNFDFDAPMNGSRARLGITVIPLSDQLAGYFGAREGVLVSAVAEGSAAEHAGLKAGDVITSVNGERVRTSNDIARAILGAADGAEVTIGIVREKKESSVKARIEPREAPRSARPI